MSDSIKIVTEPSVYLVGKQTIDNAELDRFLADHEVSHWTTDTEVAGEKLVEVAGRLCYMSFAKPRPGGNSAYIDHILEVGHGSVCEHAVFNLIITGVSRSLTHELVRHRVGMGYSQLSQRYVDESDCAFVVPPLILGYRDTLENGWIYRNWLHHVTKSQAAYVELAEEVYNELLAETWRSAGEPNRNHLAYDWGDVDHALEWIKSQPAELKTSLRKAAREAARSVLPNATETKIFVTGNARALRHFIEMRGSKHADAEIRRLACAVHKVLAEDSPNLFGDYDATTMPDGTVSLGTEYAKV